MVVEHREQVGRRQFEYGPSSFLKAYFAICNTHPFVGIGTDLKSAKADLIRQIRVKVAGGTGHSHAMSKRRM